MVISGLEMKKGYTLKAMRDRNRRLYEFWENHRDWRIRSIAKVFGISHTRVLQILRIEKAKRELVEAK